MSSNTSLLSSLSKRLAALEAEVSSLRLQNEALKSTVPLGAITAGLSAASAEDIQAWMDACKEVASSYGDLAAPSSSASSKRGKAAKSSSKTTSNSSGPEAFNKEVRAAWISLLQAADVEIADDADGEAVKKAAKTAGISYQDAMQEASRLRHIAQLVDAGKSAEEAEAEYAKIAAERAEKNAAARARAAARKAGDDSVSVASSKKSSAPSKPAASKKPAAASKKPKAPTAEELEFIAMMAEAGMSILELGSSKYWLEDESSKVFEYGAGGDLGACVGLYDADTAEIVADGDE